MLRTPPAGGPKPPYIPTPAPQTSLHDGVARGVTPLNENDITPRPQDDITIINKNMSTEDIVKIISQLQGILEERRSADKPKLVARTLDREFCDSDHNELLFNSSISPLSTNTSFTSTASLVSQVNKPSANDKSSRKRPLVSPEEGKNKTKTPKRKEKRLKKAGDLKKNVDPPIPPQSAKNGTSVDLNKITKDDTYSLKMVVDENSQNNRSDLPGPSNLSKGRNDNTVINNDPIPPIILRDSTKWAKVTRLMGINKLNFSKAQNITDGIRFYPSSEDDFRGITRLLDSESLPYHTYQLPSEKVLNVVIRGIPIGISEEEIRQDLVDMGYDLQGLHRLKKRDSKHEMPLVLVKVPKSQNFIYELTEVLKIKISVEPLRSKPGVGQCHRCQRFGHAQSRCTAEIKCVICGDGHFARDCNRPKDVPATCANCGEQHPASYRGCPRFPKLKAPAVRMPEPAIRDHIKSSQVQPGRQYSAVVASPSQRRSTMPTSILKQASSTKKTNKGRTPSKPSTPAPTSSAGPSRNRDSNRVVLGGVDINAMIETLSYLFKQFMAFLNSLKELFPGLMRSTETQHG